MDLLGAGVLQPGARLRTTRRHLGDRDRGGDGTVLLDGGVHRSLLGAAKAASGTTAEDGWKFWKVERHGKLGTLFELARHLAEVS
jgi:hypothetical protein